MDAAGALTQDHGHWQAQLDLQFEHDGQRSVLRTRRHQGPLRVQRPFYPEGEAVCHVYLLHPPGGLVPGDQVSVRIRAGDKAHALITTPAAGKVYGSDGRIARITQTLDIATDARVEWLPQEVILFDAAQADMLTRVELAPGAGFIGWEMLCLGRPASRLPFQSGQVRQRFEIWREGLPVWIERARFAGADAALQADWGLRGSSACATLVCVGAADALVAQIRDAVQVGRDELFAVTRLPDVTVCRYLGHSAQQARAALLPAWHVMREHLYGKSACVPRIWNTCFKDYLQARPMTGGARWNSRLAKKTSCLSLWRRSLPNGARPAA